MSRTAILGLLCVGLALPAAGGAQEEARPELGGQATRGGAPFPGAEVILHRVSAVEAGEIDTVTAGPDGRFRFALPSVPREDQEGDIYFASVRHQGIVYFGRAVSRAIQLDSLYAIQAYDTLTAPATGALLPVATRYIIAEEGPTGWLMTDLFEIAHEGDRTFVAAAGGATWRHPLPAGLRDPQVGAADVSSDAAQVQDGALVLSGPISPGVRQFILRYEVDTLDGLVIPLAPDTRVVEFLVREPAPDLEVDGVPGVETVEMQPGVTFRRYAGEAPSSGALRVTAADPPARLPMEWVAVVLAILLGAAGLFAVGRGGGAAAGSAASDAWAEAVPGDDGADERGRLLLEVARIDQRLEAESLEAAERAELAARRAELVARLSVRA